MSDEIRGMSFPFRIDPATGRVAMSSGRAKIQQNVRIILGTRHGERPMLREFGTRLPSLVHEPNDAALAALAENHAREMLLRWEPRILVTDSRVERHEGELVVRLTYVYTQEPFTEQMLLPLV